MPVASITTNTEDLTLTAISDVAAPLERVWDAYTNPRSLERFWGPPGWPAVFTEFDFRVGGRALYSMTGANGQSASCSWDFTAIDAPHSFEAIDSFVDDNGVPLADGQSRMVFTFEPTDTGTRVTNTGHFASAESLKQVIDMGVVEGTTLAMAQIDNTSNRTSCVSGSWGHRDGR